MTAEELLQKFDMSAHPENGAFAERHYAHEGADRASSGSIYYYVAPQEKTEFHRIDCDEYWCYTAGSTLEFWQVDADGRLKISLLGTEGEAEPFVFVKRGTVFASKHRKGAKDGTFLVCITVPRFSYEGFELIPKARMIKEYPAAAPFFEE